MGVKIMNLNNKTIRKIMKEEGAEKVSASAIKEAKIQLESILRHIARRANHFTKFYKRKIVKGKDVKLAMQDFPVKSKEIIEGEIIEEK